MKYEHILRYVAATPWAILPDKMHEILSVLAYRSAGHEFSSAEIEARIGDGNKPAKPAARGDIAVIPLRGVIAHRMGGMEEMSGGMSSERFKAMVQAAVADESVGTILVDVDSPGGTVAGLMEAADALYAAREAKRTVAIANATMASAAYWIASQASEIVAIPSALDNGIGSIGVFAVHQDLSEALSQAGIKITLIKAGEHKAEGNPFGPLTDEAKAHMQASVDAAKVQFVKAVARGRGVTPADVVANYGDGRAFSAKDALKAGLIDKIATMDDTVGRLAGSQRSAATMRADLGEARWL